ncbi:alpha/beta fold hydrolase [Paraconexibacter sp.]|uniref:alpha/beta fold hydrolase n=1 Tax=Paraconexibacter sp. TaxID=2949640 RepID=UPI003563CB26
MKQPLIEYRLDLGGVRTRVLELEGQGPPVLLFHGYSDSADTWRLALDLLAHHDRRVLAFDLPGFGQASRLARDEQVLPQLDAFGAAAVLHVAREHGPVVVGGNSLGGCLALRLAQDPDLPIVAAVPVAPAGFDHPGWFRAVQSDRLVRLLLQAPLPAPVFRTVVGEAFRQLAFAAPRAARGEVVAAFAQHLTTRRDLRRILATGSRMLPELSMPFRLERIEVPVLLIWGDRDRMVSHTGARHLLEALPDTRYELLEHVGHCPQLEVPDRFVDLLLEFAPATELAATR